MSAKEKHTLKLNLFKANWMYPYGTSYPTNPVTHKPSFRMENRYLDSSDNDLIT